jgi:prevent-host-death family protein
MYISCTPTEIDMAKRMTTAEARRDWAKVLHSAERGHAVEVTRNGQPVAAVISIEQYRELQRAKSGTLADVIAWREANVDPRDLEGPDPWKDVRDRSPGRDVALG